MKYLKYIILAGFVMAGIFGYIRKSENMAFGATSYSPFKVYGQLQLLNAATSTGISGMDMSAGCYAINGSCISGSGGGGSGTVSSGTVGQLGYYNSSGTTITGTSTNPIYVDAFYATSTTATSTIGKAGLQLGAGGYNSSGYDNQLSLIAQRTYGNSNNAAFKEGQLNIDATNNGRIAFNLVQQSDAGTGCSPECINIQQQSTTATGLLEKIKTASTQFSGNLGISIEGPTAPALELNQDIWNGGTLQEGGGLFQISSRDNNFTIDARNDTNKGYCRQLDLSPDFSSTTAGTITFFPCLNSGGSTQLGTGRLNITGTSTVANLVNFDSTNTSTQGDIMVIKENGQVGIATTTPSQKLDVNGNINLEAAGNGIIMHDDTNGLCYLFTIHNGTPTATAHVCQ